MQAFAEPSQQADTGAGVQGATEVVSTNKDHHDQAQSQHVSDQQAAATAPQAAASPVPEGNSNIGPRQHQQSSPSANISEAAALAGHTAAVDLPAESASPQDGKLMSLLMD